jgi:hypothetical protein
MSYEMTLNEYIDQYKGQIHTQAHKAAGPFGINMNGVYLNLMQFKKYITDQINEMCDLGLVDQGSLTAAQATEILFGGVSNSKHIY